MEEHRKGVQEVTQRICVTISADMLDELKELAEMTGFSISRLVRLRLELRGPIIVVPEAMTEELKAIHGLIESAISSGKFDPNILEAWEKRVEVYDSLVDYASHATFVYAQKKRRVSRTQKGETTAFRNEKLAPCEKAQDVAGEERGAVV